MIALFTDFGVGSPYVGQMKAALYSQYAAAVVIDLLADAPVHNPQAAAYLLAAYPQDFPVGSVFLAVVDPGVGDPARRAAAVSVDGQWFVGPDNGLFNVVASRGHAVQWWDITWRPERLSASFHGRDLFAPVAARLARGESPPGEVCDLDQRLLPDWPDDLAEIIYIDHFGNAMTGLRADRIGDGACLASAGHRLKRARTFSDVAPGEPFWYENANGLAEIAVNQGRADRRLGLTLGEAVVLV